MAGLGGGGLLVVAVLGLGGGGLLIVTVLGHGGLGAVTVLGGAAASALGDGEDGGRVLRLGLALGLQLDPLEPLAQVWISFTGTSPASARLR